MSGRSPRIERGRQDLAELGGSSALTSKNWRSLVQQLEAKKLQSRRHIHGFRRFLLRGLHRVSLEIGRLSLAHHLLKKAANDQNRSHSGSGRTS
ncbi:hypothetical protein ACFW1P_20140 [Paenibacillus sp. NPDC058910]|uniref:hypothetical protein n=1 Tax=unclassified Paenibacillus TaxID=185978 RepID=UPI00368D7D8C